MTNNLSKIVNVQVANWNVLYVKLHNFHWFVKGPQFFTLACPIILEENKAKLLNINVT
jgi:starvation-inducible DNA-binding protein